MRSSSRRRVVARYPRRIGSNVKCDCRYGRDRSDVLPFVFDRFGRRTAARRPAYGPRPRPRHRQARVGAAASQRHSDSKGKATLRLSLPAVPERQDAGGSGDERSIETLSGTPGVRALVVDGGPDPRVAGGNARARASGRAAGSVREGLAALGATPRHILSDLACPTRMGST